MGGSLKIFKASKETLCYANKDIHENDSVFNKEIGLFYMKSKLYAQG